MSIPNALTGPVHSCQPRRDRVSLETPGKHGGAQGLLEPELALGAGNSPHPPRPHSTSSPWCLSCPLLSSRPEDTAMVPRGAHVTLFLHCPPLRGISLSSWSRYLRGTSDWPSPSFRTRPPGTASLHVTCLHIGCQAETGSGFPSRQLWPSPLTPSLRRL